MPTHSEYHIDAFFLKENRSGKTCLIIALEKQFLDIAEILIRNKVSVNTAAYSGNTPLHFACNADQYKMAKMLLDQDADVSVRNMDGQSPKDLATSKEVSQCFLRSLLLLLIE